MWFVASQKQPWERDGALIDPDEIRSLFSAAVSDMYRAEVPQYGALLDLVSDVNQQVLAADLWFRTQFERSGESTRRRHERHGAIRLGTISEFAMMRRLFAVLAMVPVGYYDLTSSGIPVHSTAFRPVAEASLQRNPFRMFTSVLRLDLIPDEAVRSEALAILERRDIFSARLRVLIDRFENGGLTDSEAREFVSEARQTFQWHAEATVSAKTYRKLRAVHSLVADIVCFKGPHINHLTPRTHGEGLAYVRYRATPKFSESRAAFARRAGRRSLR